MRDLESNFLKMNREWEYFSQLYEKELDYQKITDDFLDITGAELAVLHLYEEDTNGYTTMAVAGNQGLIKKVVKMIGIEIEGKKGGHDAAYTEKTKDNTITRFSSLKELAGDAISKTIVDLVVKTFQIGETVVIKILNNTTMLGDFTLMMGKDTSFNQRSIVEVYTRQLGLVIIQKRTANKLEVLQEDYEKVFHGTQDSMFVVEVADNHTFTYVRNNDAHQKSTGITNEDIRGKTPQELLGEKVGNYVATNYHRCVQGAVPITYEETLEVAGHKRIWTTSLTPVVEQERVVCIVGSSRDITETKQAEEALRKSRESLANILEGTNVGTWEWYVQTGETVFNERWAGIIGYTLEEISPVSIETWAAFTHPEDLKKSEAELGRVFAGEIDYYDIECRMKHKDDSWVWVQDRGKVITWTTEGKPLLMSGTHTDITHRKSMEIVFSNEKKFLETTLQSVGDGVISTDSKGNIILLNKAAEYLTGWTQETARAKPIEEVFHRVDALTRKKSENRIRKVLESGERLEAMHDAILISKEGTQRFIEERAAPIMKENGEIIGVVVVFRDYSEKKAKQEEILYLSYHDQLTGLYNRRFYEEELKRLDIKTNFPLTIVLADVNGLKLINDSFGYLIGDELLRKAAEVMMKGCREDDVVARIGGDEFIILLPKTDIYQANQIINTIKSLALKEKVGAFETSISFGYEAKNNEEEMIQDTFKNAEDYMYRNKLYESSSMRNKTIDLIVNTLYEKSNREMLHSKRVSEICEAIAVNMNFDQETVNKIRIAGLMHDIGKMGIDEKILNKPEKLSDDEWKEIKKHPEIGYRILSSVNEFSEMAGYILQHHERWDGKGYPKGLKGEEIALQARIITVADAYDAMVSLRAYSKPLKTKEAIAEIKKCAGYQFDPEIAWIFTEKVLAK